MGKIYASADELIGHTPLLELQNLEKTNKLSSKILAKLEFFNPAGSVKDRVAKNMIDAAEQAGILTDESVIIEPTSGNTGIGLASVAAARKYRCIIVMPDSMSMERRMLMTAYGAELVLTKGTDGMRGAVEKANALAREIPHSFIPGQFENPANPGAHIASTGPEIWEDTDGNIDIFIAGIGTGGTVSGVGAYLKAKNPNIQIIGVEPYGSPLLTKGCAGPHKIQGIGANFVPKVLNRDILDEVISVSDKDAFESARAVGKQEGVLIGISAGAAIHAALVLASRPQNKGKNIVVLVPDSGDRYLTSHLYQ